MFERYTEKARRVIFFARYEAAQFGGAFIETEHLLLGVLREDQDLALRFLGPGVARSVAEALPLANLEASRQRLEALQKQLEDAIANRQFEKARAYSELQREERETVGDPVASIRRRIEAVTQPRSKVSSSVDLPLSHESKRVLGYAAEECERLNHQHIAPEHLFLGLMREQKCLAADILHERGLRLAQVREEITRSGSAETGRPDRGQTGGFDPRPARLGGRLAWMAALQDSARVLILARHEAVQRHSTCIETTDLLLALTHEKEVRERFLVSADSVRRQKNLDPVAAHETVSAEELPFSENFKLACTFAIEEAAQLGQNAGAGHLLLGILRIESCAAAKTLRDCGLTTAGIRARLAPPPPSPDPEQGRSYV